MSLLRHYIQICRNPTYFLVAFRPTIDVGIIELEQCDAWEVGQLLGGN